MMQVTFREIASVLDRTGSRVVAAEGHGCLCGALCTTADYTLERWLNEIISLESDPMGEQVEAEPSLSSLRVLFDDTRRALRGQQMEFQLLLPDDDEPLEQRAAALAQWCQGFLYGFGTGKPVAPERLKGQIDEILRDLTEIARATVGVEAPGEEEEQAYAEIVEYLRVGVQLIHDELADMRDADAPDDGAAPSAGPDDLVH